MALRKYTRKQIVEIFRQKHGDKYGYTKLTKSTYTMESKIIVTCPEHGDFSTTVLCHIESFETGGCHKCRALNKNNSVKKKRASVYFPTESMSQKPIYEQ